MPSTPDAPKPLDSGQLANTQRTENARAAQQNAGWNRLNQRDQFGNTMNFQRVGTDADGNPRFQLQQALGATGRNIQRGMNGLANQFFEGANNYLSNPFQVDSEVEGRLYNLGASRVDPRMQQSRAALQQQLANQGIAVGSEAYTNAMRDFGQQENDAYNSLALQARGQAYNEALGERQQGISELGGLAGLGVQYGMNASNPNFQNYAQIGIPAIDTIGLEQMRYGQEMDQYNQQMQQNNAFMGGLAGLGGTLLGMPMMGGGSLGGNMIGGLFGLGSSNPMHNPSSWNPTINRF